MDASHLPGVCEGEEEANELMSLGEHGSEVGERSDDSGLVRHDTALVFELPQLFRQFLNENGVPLDAYRLAEPTPRYIRINPRAKLNELPLGDREHALALTLLGNDREKTALRRVAWLEPRTEIYSFPATANLSRSSLYREAEVYGIDAASVAAVLCLEPMPGETLLDLCCAPGAKLCLAADLVQPGGQVVGVDVSERRLAVCRTLLRKYGVQETRLVLADGRTWTPAEAIEWRGSSLKGRKKKRRQRGSDAPPPPPFPLAFDRVLVDAECTHDGSLKHIEKYRTQWGWETLANRVPWVQQGEMLRELQLALLTNGFRLLRDGGVLVYSTCSFCRSQNEDIVAAFLATEPSAVLDPLPLQPNASSVNTPAGETTLGPRGTMPALASLLAPDREEGVVGQYCGARFDPKTSGTSGLFVARMRRRCLNSSV